MVNTFFFDYLKKNKYINFGGGGGGGGDNTFVF